MSQNITLLGASYSDVPSVLLPKTGGGTASFTDVTDTTAVAADVASGKLFHASDGSLVTGTASGGGGSMVQFAIRPDATLAFSQTYDAHIVGDEGVTIPSYTTSQYTLLAAKSSWAVTPQLAIPSGVGNGTSFLFVWHVYAIPEYSSTTKSKGRQDYWIGSYVHEYMINGGFRSLDGSKTSGNFTQGITCQTYRTAYWTSATAFATAQQNYGAYLTPSIGSASTGTSWVQFRFSRPAMYIRGSGTYFTSANWNLLTDIRYVAKIEVYQAPIGSTTSLNGWTGSQNFWASYNEIRS